ncbi:MAG: arsenite methyltransferase [Chloroflexi bacterium]|nr:arsenite methyltransferase [Chloroflexota bacterium]
MKLLQSIEVVQAGCGDGGCACGKGGPLEKPDLDEAIQNLYGKVAERGANNTTVDASCCGNATALYSETELESITPQAAGASAGCGNPVGIAEVRSGEKVLDLGSGGGIDCFLAARAAGPEGHVYGVDMTPAMLKLARDNAATLDAQNVTFLLGKIEAVPLPDAIVDLVISNCVIALAPDKRLVFDEIFRLLKPGGRLVVSDIVSTSELPEKARADMAEWAACIGGADLMSRYIDRITETGFERTEVLTEEKFVSDQTDDQWRDSLRSITVRAFKPAG